VAKPEQEGLWIGKTFDFLMYNFPPGPRLIPINYSVNFQKAGMTLYIIGLMFYYNNFSTAMLYYLYLHGSYGFFWLLKDMIFPDPAF
jgi:hypothetical protein